ncbi:MAG: DUF2442 domain-containing protein [Oscillospiraceae bacterium]|nr:DUF2442 domain-containing protein [Oscillospiraceae bacterium]
MSRPKLFQVLPTDDFKVYLYYDNGEIKQYDCAWVLRENGVFSEIHDIATFMDVCTIMNGTLAFDISRIRDPYSCIDICPDTVYEDSVKCGSDSLSA